MEWLGLGILQLNLLGQRRGEGNTAALEHAQRQRHHHSMRPHRLRLQRTQVPNRIASFKNAFSEIGFQTPSSFLQQGEVFTAERIHWRTLQSLPPGQTKEHAQTLWQHCCPRVCLH
jgi:hypothetical protein